MTILRSPRGKSWGAYLPPRRIAEENGGFWVLFTAPLLHMRWGSNSNSKPVQNWRTGGRATGTMRLFRGRCFMTRDSLEIRPRYRAPDLHLVPRAGETSPAEHPMHPTARAHGCLGHKGVHPDHPYLPLAGVARARTRQQHLPPRRWGRRRVAGERQRPGGPRGAPPFDNGASPGADRRDSARR